MDLEAVLDELVYTYALDPKNVCKAIRSYLTRVIRCAGAYALKQPTFVHNNLSAMPKDHSGALAKEDFDGSEYFKVYVETATMREGFKEGRETLRNLGMHHLSRLLDVYLETSLVKTDPRDFVLCGSFLQSIMALAGYGRALNFASSLRSADPLSTDALGVGDEIESILLQLNDQALEKGFTPPTGEKWIPTCIASLKSTSAGVAPITIEIRVRGKTTKVKHRKKAAIGVFMGKSAFRRNELKKVTSMEMPGSVGYRDVPYKPTRAIYVVRLPTQYAQIAVIQHLVNFISTKGEKSARVVEPIDPSFFTTSPHSTTGRRLNDTYDTIAASGDRTFLALGTDLASFDANCVNWNFRKPMVSALVKMLRGKTYGPDNISGTEMVNFAYGEGIIYNSLWDNGREPIIYFNPDADPAEKHPFKEWVIKQNVRAKSYKLKSLPAASVLKPGEYEFFDIDRYVEESTNPIPWHLLRVGVRMDGDDLIRLTSEASGELSTLMMNTVANLAMQRIALKLLRNTKFGEKFKPIYMKGVGDDSEWIGQLMPGCEAEDIDFALQSLTENYKKMGHTFSPAKTYVIPLSGEYIQTYARFGLMIPKDQIMVIPSEKPRSVRDVTAFLGSLKQVFLMKCARGFNLDFAGLTDF